MRGRALLGRAAIWVACVALLLVGWTVADPSGGADVAVVPAAGVPPPPVRIMPLGASSTSGNAETGGYRGPLERRLAADGVTFDMVGSQISGPSWMPDRHHEGHPGTTIPMVLNSVPGWVRAAHPDIVLLHVGTNDLLGGATGAQTTVRLQQILSAIYDADGGPEPYVIVAGVWAPMKGREQGKADYAKGAAQLVATLRKQGRPITYVDTAALLPPGDVADGLHANGKGYELIAAMWEREITGYLATRNPAAH